MQLHNNTSKGRILLLLAIIAFSSLLSPTRAMTSMAAGPGDDRGGEEWPGGVPRKMRTPRISDGGSGILLPEVRIITATNHRGSRGSRRSGRSSRALYSPNAQQTSLFKTAEFDFSLSLQVRFSIASLVT